MLRNYFKIALRVLLQNKVYGPLNLAGLGLAQACCILAFLNYEFRAGFVFTLLILLLSGAATIAIKVFRAATANLTDSLRRD